MNKIINYKLQIFAIFLFPFAICNCLHSALISHKAGTTSATFLKIGVGARPISMGSAFSAISDDINAIYWNPAGLAQLKFKEIGFMHNEWFQDIRYEFLGYAHPYRKNVFGVSASGVYMPSDLERRSGLLENIPEEPITTAQGTFGAFDIGVIASYARDISKGFYLGTNMKIIKQQIDDKGGFGWGFDFGTLYKFPNKKISLSFVLQNVGVGVKFIEKRYGLPFNVKFGIGGKILNDKMLLALDFNQPIDNFFNFGLGLEYELINILFLRAGYKYRAYGNELGNWSGLSAGLGFRYKGFGLDYAFAPYGVLGDAHRVSISYKFGLGGEKEKIKPKILKEPERILKSSDDKGKPIKEVTQVPKNEKVLSPLEELESSFSPVERNFSKEVLGASVSGQDIKFTSEINDVCLKKIVIYGIVKLGDIKLLTGETAKDDSYRNILIKHNMPVMSFRKMEITFNVSKDWVSKKGLSEKEISLYRFDGNDWVKIQTELVSSDEKEYIYKSVSPNFSVFSVK